MQAKACGNCVYWTPSVNNMGVVKNGPGFWGDCIRAEDFPDWNGSLVTIHPIGAAKLRTRSEFYCSEFRDLARDKKQPLVSDSKNKM